MHSVRRIDSDDEAGVALEAAANSLDVITHLKVLAQLAGGELERLLRKRSIARLKR